MGLVLDSGKVLVFRFFSHANGTPEVQMIVRFLEVLAPYGEKLRVGRDHYAVEPAREKKEEGKTDVSCEKSLKNPEGVRLEYVSEEAEGQGETGCNLVVSSRVKEGQSWSIVTARERKRPSASRVVHHVFRDSATTGLVSRESNQEIVRSLTSTGLWRTPNSTVPSQRGTRPSECLRSISRRPPLEAVECVWVICGSLSVRCLSGTEGVVYIFLPQEPSCSRAKAVKPSEGINILALRVQRELPGGPTEMKVEAAAAPLHTRNISGLEM